MPKKCRKKLRKEETTCKMYKINVQNYMLNVKMNRLYNWIKIVKGKRCFKAIDRIDFGDTRTVCISEVAYKTFVSVSERFQNEESSHSAYVPYTHNIVFLLTALVTSNTCYVAHNKTYDLVDFAKAYTYIKLVLNILTPPP